MCAKIYQYTPIDNTLVLNSREGLLYPFNFSGSWTELRIGMYVSVVSGSNMGPAVAETVTISSPNDFFSIGIKDSTSGVIPGYNGASFIGTGAGVIGTHTVVRNISNTIRLSNNDVNWYYYGCPPYATHNTTTMTSSVVGWNGEFYSPVQVTATSSYCSGYTIQFRVNNGGQPSQSVTVYAVPFTPGSSTQYTSTQLTADLVNLPFNSDGTGLTLPWSVSGSALPLPDAFWFRCPLAFNQVRLSAICVERIS